jgi:hypothetical protein
MCVFLQMIYHYNLHHNSPMVDDFLTLAHNLLNYIVHMVLE